MNSTSWHIKDFNPQLVASVAKEFGVPNAIAKIMSIRGVVDRDISSSFFTPKKNDLHDPYLLKDMDKAVKRIHQQKMNNNKLMIFGDYDVDGVSSTAMLYKFFQSADMNVSYYIPHRDIDGYGLSKRGIDFANSIGADLIITCDCGINAFEQIEYAAKMDIDVIVTDHHKPEKNIPECIAVINPNRKDCDYPFKGLCGAGVAFKLAFALAPSLSVDPESIWQYSDLITLGIAADIVPMIDENRIISHFGLKMIRAGTNIGIRSLIETSNLNIDLIGIGQIVFWITPKINAAGRLGEASRAVKLLTSENPVYSMDIAKLLNNENEKRKIITLNMQDESMSMVENYFLDEEKKGIVLFEEGWHSGVIGIVASRIKEIYNKPTIIIGIENGVGKGSCRSISGFDIVDALDHCEALLDGHGGHPMAAGLTINQKKIVEFREKFESYCEVKIKKEDLIPIIYIDAEIKIGEINSRLINFLKYLEPYGPKNSKPKFSSKNIIVEGNPRIIGKDQSTIKFKIRQEQSIFEAIAFRMIDEYEKLISGRLIDIVYNISENHWNGKTSLQLEIKGIRYSDE